MSLFMVTTDGFTPLVVRSGPGREFSQVGSLSVGTTITSLDSRTTVNMVPPPIPPGSSGISGEGLWHQIGVNRWVNETLIGGGVNARLGPGVLGFRQNYIQVPQGQQFLMTHRTGSHSPLCNLSGHWFRRSDGRWMHSSTLRLN